MERVHDWMTREPLFTPPVSSAEQVLVMMNKNRVRHILVRDGDTLMGIVSNRDFVRAALQASNRVLDLQATTAEQIMTPSPLLAARPDTPLGDAARLMEENQVSALPVIDDGEVVGIITTSDFLRAFWQGVEAPIG